MNTAQTFRVSRILLILFALVFTVLVVAACGGDAPAPTAEPTPAEEVEATEADANAASEETEETEEAEETDETDETEEAAESDETEEAAESDETEEAEETEEASEPPVSAGGPFNANARATRMLVLRQEPSQIAPSVAQVARDGLLEVLDADSTPGWYYARTEDGTEGWAPSQLVERQMEAAGEAIGTGTINASTRMRAEPALTSAATMSMNAGFEVSVLSEPQDGWVQIELPDGRIGWVQEEFIDINE